MSIALGDVIAGYLDLRWQMNPVEATHDGRHEHDGSYARWDATSVREFLAALRSYESALEEADADSLDDEIDRTAALHALRHDVLVLERERPFVRDPALHLGHALSGLFLLLVRNAQDPPRRAAALLERLRTLPAFLASAAEVVTEPDTVAVSVARAMLPGGLALVRDGLDDPSVDLSSLEPLELAHAREEAVTALRTFADALALASERARDRYAIGRELFDRKLHTAHMIPDGADELYRYGERLRAEAVEMLERIAREIDPGVSWRDLVPRLRADAPTADRALDELAEATEAARQFTVVHELASVPEGELCVVPTPEFLRSLVPFAAYQGPGALDEMQRGFFFVTLPEAGAPWRAPARAELPSTALHETIPGHHLQIVTANRLERVPRRILSTPATREGWAFYCESLMAEMGFLDTPAERFFQAHNLLWRALRVLLDVALHTRGMTVTAAASMLEEELGFTREEAEAEVRRYCAYPTYQLCYAVGRREILRLRDDARRRARGDFSLGAFHAELLRYGAYPTALARWGMRLEE